MQKMRRPLWRAMKSRLWSKIKERQVSDDEKDRIHAQLWLDVTTIERKLNSLKKLRAEIVAALMNSISDAETDLLRAEKREINREFRNGIRQVFQEKLRTKQKIYNLITDFQSISVNLHHQRLNEAMDFVGENLFWCSRITCVIFLFICTGYGSTKNDPTKDPEKTAVIWAGVSELLEKEKMQFDFIDEDGRPNKGVFRIIFTPADRNKIFSFVHRGYRPPVIRMIY